MLICRKVSLYFMTPIDMQQDAIDIATQALEKFNIEKDIAAFVKKEFDKKYNPTWHAIVGKHLAVTDRKELWVIHHSRDEALHLLLSGASGYSSLQIWMSKSSTLNSL